MSAAVPRQKFLSIANDWLTDRPTKLQRLERWVKAFWYTKIKCKIKGWSTLHWIAKTTMASSAPFVAWYFNEHISGWQATVVSSVIFIGLSITALFEYASKAKSRNDNGIVEVVTRFGELMLSFPRGRGQPTHVDDHIRSALGIIESVARDVTSSERSAISVCLAMYEDCSREKMNIRHRNPGSARRTNKSFDAAGTIAHHACMSGPDPRVVNDICVFGPTARQSPTQSEASYRSIYIVPIVRSNDSNLRVCGFISIDSANPYAFYGNKANSIIIVCEPIISHIQDLLTGGEQ